MGDLCLKLDATAVAKAKQGMEVRVLSDRRCWFLVGPKGDCTNPWVGAQCGDSASNSQRICVTGIPNATSPCDFGAAQEFIATHEYIDSLSCPCRSGCPTTTEAPSVGT